MATTMNVSRREFVAASVAAASMYGAAPPPRGRFSQFDLQARRLLSTLTLDQKVGQMTQADHQFLQSDDDIAKYHLGSILSGVDSDPKSGNDLKSWTDLYDHFQSVALKASPRIPLLYGIDAVHGHNNVLGAT